MKKLLLLGFLIIAMALAVQANPIINPIANQTVAEGATGTVTVTASAPNSGSTSFGISPLAAWVTAVPSGNNLVLTLAPGYTNSGSYTFTITASDTDSTDTEIMYVTVTDSGAAPTNVLTVSEVIIGSNNQVRSNPDSDDEDDEDVYDDATFTIKNDGTAAVTITNIQSTADSKYNVTFSGFPATINPGASTSFTATGRIHEDLDSFFPLRTGLDDRKVELGAVTVTGTVGTTLVTGTSTLYMEAENHLEIDEITVFVNGDEQETITATGKSIKDIIPGDEIQLIVKLKNTFSTTNSENLDIDEITAHVVIDEDTIDIDEEEDGDSTEPKGTTEIEINFDVDEDADTGTFDMVVIAQGIDEFDATHGERWNLDFKVTRESHEIRIINVDSPEELSCKANDFDVRVTIKNVGKDDTEKAVSLKVYSDDFNFNERLFDIDLSQNEETTKSFTIKVPEDLAEGANFITIETYYERTKLSPGANPRIVQVDMPDCTPAVVQPTVPQQPEEDEDTTVVFVNQSAAASGSDGVIIASDISSSTESFGSNAIIIVLVVVIIIAIVSIGLSIALFTKMNKKQ